MAQWFYLGSKLSSSYFRRSQRELEREWAQLVRHAVSKDVGVRAFAPQDATPVTISTHRRRINSRHRSRQSPIWSITPSADRECESAKRRKEFPPPHRFPPGRASYLITLSNEPLIGGCRPSAPRMSSAQCGGRWRLDPQPVADSGACQGGLRAATADNLPKAFVTSRPDVVSWRVLA